MSQSSNRAKLVRVLLQQHIPFVMYRLPQSDDIITLIQYQSEPLILDSVRDLHLQSGFLFAPFPGKGNYPCYFLEPDLVIHNIDDITPDLIYKLSVISRFANYSNAVHTQVETDAATFLAQVELAKAAMQQGAFQKVILSRVHHVPVPQMPEIVALFDALCEVNPHAMVYFTSMAEAGCWMGASPEPLAVQEEGRIRTVSLAGTQLLSASEWSEIRWGVKEIAEQAFVSRFIVMLFDRMGIDNFEITGPENFAAGNLVHLLTGFHFPIEELKIPMGEFMSILHPTPAIAGLPRREALAFIDATEEHDRGYYAGLLGPYNLEGSTHVYVNLRSMQLFEQELVFYSGAGITASSDPDKEWQETTNKMMTIRRVLDV